MNFIKKKIKGSKKGYHDDDDDFDPNQFFPSAATNRPHDAPKDWVPYEERLDEESEEWLAYKQLTSRITETLQKTQDNLTKIVAHSAVQPTQDQTELFPVPSVHKPAPPRPPPPNERAAGPPPRPPPPSANDSVGADEGKVEFGFDSEPSGLTNGRDYEVPDFGDEDFGVPPLTDDGDDPFDTSFVDVQSSIARTQVRARPRARDRSDSSEVGIRKLSVGAKRAKVPEPVEVDSGSLSIVDMNPYVPPTSRSKSPNPFLSDSPCEPSATNPFLNGPVDVFSVTPAPLEPVAGNPFAPAVVDDFFGLSKPPVPPPPKKRPSLVEELFGMDTGLDPFVPTSSAEPADLFDTLSELTAPVQPKSQNFRNFDLFDASLPDEPTVRPGAFGPETGSRRDLAKIPDLLAGAPIDVFDAFDSAMEPMNTFDGLPPAHPKIKIEIPVELKQNADVFEALGQRGPKTPVEPVGFDPPTPCPEDSDLFNLESEISDIVETASSVVEGSTQIKDSEQAEEPCDWTADRTGVEEVRDDSGVSVAVESPPKSTETNMDDAAFDAFEARFHSASVPTTDFDAFGGIPGQKSESDSRGFGPMDEFDPFLSMTEPPAVPQPSPARFPGPETRPQTKVEDDDSDSDDSGPDFSIFIRPKMREKSEVPTSLGLPVLLPPPPKSPVRSPIRSPVHEAPEPRTIAFDPNAVSLMGGEDWMEIETKPKVPEPTEPKSITPPPASREMERMESQESIGSPLFDEDDSEPLEDFPATYAGPGWNMVLRQPNKKKITGQRFWKKVFVSLTDHVLHLYHTPDDKDPFQELPLQACYSVSEISAQQFDQYGKIFTLKLQYVFYRERVGVRPGQITKVAQGQITSFGQLAKLGLPLEHAPQVSQLLKLGCQDYCDLKVFARQVEDALFRLTAHRDRALTYKTEEVQVTVQDECYCDVAKSGHVNKQLARVRVFFLAFISGMPDIEVGLNDLPKKGKEVVGRYDIIPVVTEEWIRLENLEFHSCVGQAEFDKTRNIKFHPPDACFFELLRFRVRPPKVRELPLQVKAVLTIEGNRIELRIDVLVPGYSSRKHGQVPCEDISFRYLLPECWIYLFRVEKHFRYGSLKSASRKPGKIKGLERLMGATQSGEPSLIEVTTGQAKYEHHHRSLVWRVPRLPKEGQGAYTEHSFVCRFELTSYDQMPDELDESVHVEFTMPASFVSHTTVRSVSVSNQNPPEKHVRYQSKCEYRVGVERVDKFAENVYVSAAAVGKSSPQRPPSSASSSSPH